MNTAMEISNMQSTIWEKSEGDAWFRRNKESLDSKICFSDPIFNYLKSSGCANETVLEVGCSTGYRLNWLSQQMNCKVIGVDPSREAISYGKRKYKLKLFAPPSMLDFWKNIDGRFDKIVFGFCLYVIDPEVLPLVVSKVNQMLKPGGEVIIYDFYGKNLFKDYEHANGIKSYRCEWEKLFCSFPQYKLIFKESGHHLNFGSKIFCSYDEVALLAIRKIAIDDAFAKLK